jgi:DNA-directed RNA polymerase subunit RPC12/RpoP
MNFVLLQSYDNYVSAHIAMGRLEEDGIKCWLQDENTVTIYPVWSNALGGIKLMVAEAQAEKAASILKEVDRQHKETITCPRCGSHNIEVVSTPRKVSNWLSALWGLLFTNYAMPVDMVNHCFDCGKEFIPEEATKNDTNDLTNSL